MLTQNISALDAPPVATPRRTPVSPEQALQFSAGRVRDVAALRGLGFSYREIAKHYGVTPQAISLLLTRNRRQMKAIGGSPELANLSARACSALQRLGVQSRQDALAADVLQRLSHARNCGRKTLEEIADWIKATAHNPYGQAALTLIELLVVISIIASLASLAFPAVQGALRGSKRAQARNDVNQLASAVKSYALEYGRLPEEGSEVASLTGGNPKKIVFFEAKNAKNGKNGLDGDKLRDPWGNPYTFQLDDDYDNKVNGILTTVIVESQGDPNQTPRQTISNVK
jgi:prepilin-type N-terminal cleavage/methylation domain-containing protein